MDVQTWFTAQECAGMPGFPSGVSNVRKQLEKLSEGLEGVRRKRGGTKATEYHISILPARTKNYLGYSDAGQPSEGLGEAKSGLANDEKKALWMMIYHGMTEAQREAVVEIFITGGLKMLMPAVLELSDSNQVQRKEIFEQRNSDEQVSPASSVSTQSKAG
ncbi:TPA: hypothetical protein U2I07_002587 [Citrobacter koseri]|uniref:Phage transposase n=1 Tax=Citrobacter koseri TaxID=545 RepID=A0A3S4IZW0_CITKO|nr:phage transposase [Citrobacter koseri]HEM6672524.1 hypothetical protein [Citrobacter koseri]